MFLSSRPPLPLPPNKKVNAAGALELYAIGVDRVPTKWASDRRHEAERRAAGEAEQKAAALARPLKDDACVPSFSWAHPSRWRPASKRAGSSTCRWLRTGRNRRPVPRVAPIATCSMLWPTPPGCGPASDMLGPCPCRVHIGHVVSLSPAARRFLPARANID